MVYLNRPYTFTFFVDCLSQILLSLFLNTLPHIALNPLASGIHKRSYILKSYPCYKSIFCHKVALDVQLIFLFEEKMFRSQHTLCCCEITNCKICDVIIDIATK